jgi:hypothetical protein
MAETVVMVARALLATAAMAATAVRPQTKEPIAWPTAATEETQTVMEESLEQVVPLLLPELDLRLRPVRTE